MESRSADRRAELLDATLRILARDGATGVTHRAVAHQAGMANGATTYHFATRDGLLEAALRHLAEREVHLARRELEQIAAAGDRVRIGELAAFLAERLAKDRTSTLARYELFAEAARRPALRPALREWRAAYVELLVSVIPAGSGLPGERRAETLLNLLNGLLLEATALGRHAGVAARLEGAILDLLATPSSEAAE